MTDYLLKFPDETTATMFGLQHGFARIDEDGNAQITIAAHGHNLCVIGEHYVFPPEIDGAPQPPVGDGKWWVFFRDFADIQIPEGASQYIHWSSASGEPIPTDASTPNIPWL